MSAAYAEPIQDEQPSFARAREFGDEVEQKLRADKLLIAAPVMQMPAAVAAMIDTNARATDPLIVASSRLSIFKA